MIFINLRKFLFFIAKSRFSSIFIGLTFEYLTALMPVREKSDNNFALIFAHPSPFWETHYLIVPKKRIPSFIAVNLSDKESLEYIVNIFSLAHFWTTKKGVEEYSLLVNGGHYQEVPQMHFHLYHGQSRDGVMWGIDKYEPPSDESEIQEHLNAFAYPKPHPNREFHYIISSNLPEVDMGSAQTDLDTFRSTLADILEMAQMIIVQRHLEEYSVLTSISPNSENIGLVFHLVSGSRI